MTPLTRRRTRSVLAACALAGMLTGCSGLPVGAAESSPGLEAPGLAIPENCGVSGERVNAIIDEALAELGPIQESVLAGEVPDLAALFAPFTSDILSLTEGVTDPEMLQALTDVQQAMQGFGEIPAPANVLEAAGYVQELTTQFQELKEAGARLQQLCR